MSDSEEFAVQIKTLNKTYKIYNRPLDLLYEVLFKKQKHVSYEALNDINLNVRHGEVIGILGRNGAGKSTLLKILSGTLEKTSGSLEINGKVTAILELGTGFHADYTGRENIYMGGMCLGMTRKEIDLKIADIIAFSGLGEHIDCVFRTYSTGMQARLTFSTAAAVEPDILIVDEALSVGDASFQLKCFNRINELKESDTTIIIVSHDMSTITTFCDRALIIEDGKVYKLGTPDLVTKEYHKLLFGNSNEQKQSNSTDDSTVKDNEINAAINRYGDGAINITRYGIINTDRQLVNYLNAGETYHLEFAFVAKQTVEQWSGGFAIFDIKGTLLYGTTNTTEMMPPFRVENGQEVIVKNIIQMNLAAGDYFITLGVSHLDSGEKMDFIENAIEFKVVGTDNIFSTSVVNMASKFAMKMI